MLLWATEDDDLEGEEDVEEGATDFGTADDEDDDDDDDDDDDAVVLLMVCPPTSPPWLNSPTPPTPSTSVPPPRADLRILTMGASDDGGWGPLADPQLARAPDAKRRLQCIQRGHVRYGRWYDVVLTRVEECEGGSEMYGALSTS